MYIYYNPNPSGLSTDDCVIRAISKITNQSWERTYVELSVQGFYDHAWGSANHVWGNYLKSLGFIRRIIPNSCPDCYTVKDFCFDNPYGSYLLAISGHVVAVVDGNYYDTYDSGNEVPIYYWEKR